jgi:HAD superfamily hydrolase (TIGR01484 family)
LNAASDIGTHVAVATGRRFPSAAKFLRTLGVDPFVIANTGAIVKDGLDGGVLRRRMLPIEIANETLGIAEREGAEPIVHDGPEAEGHLTLRDSARRIEAFARYLNETSPPPRWVPQIRLTQDPVQIGFAATVDEIRRLARTFASELGASLERVHLARTEYVNEDLALLDVLEAGATKSSALRFLCEHLGVERDETLAIGDNWNDVDMLEAAGLGVVMGNAADELHSRGFAKTSTNDEAGVARAVERFVLSVEGGKKKGG